jgi:uncharacterized membrane protein YqiK
LRQRQQLITITATQLTIAGVVVLVLVGGAVLWWVVRALMGWHSGRALYWLGQPRDDDAAEDDDDPDDSTGMNSP